MLKKWVLRLSKGLLIEVAGELIESVVNQIQQEISGFDKMTETEQKIANEVLDLVEARGVAILKTKLEGL